MFEGALGTLLAVLGVTAAVAFVIAYLAASVRQVKNNTLRATNADLLQRVEVLETAKAALELQVANQQAQIDALRDLATGTPLLSEMRKDFMDFLERHEAHAAERYQFLIEGQDKVAEAIGHFAKEVSRATNR